MSDLIDRQAAIEAMRKCQTYRFSATEPRMIMLAAAEEVIEELPSVRPQKVCVAEVKVEIDDIKDYIDKAIDAERWVSCSERLPETNGRYIVTRGLKACNAIWNRVYIINYSDLMGLKAKKIWWDGNVGKSDFQEIDDVVAWMPLPEPWEGEQE